MARYDPKAAPLNENAEQQRERLMQVELKAGNVVQMKHPSRGVDYINNDPKSIKMKILQGWAPLEPEKKAPKKSAAKDKK